MNGATAVQRRLRGLRSRGLGDLATTSRSRRASNGSLRERLRFKLQARRVRATVEWPCRLPHRKGQRVADQIEIGQGVFLGKRSWFNMNAPTSCVSIGAGCIIGTDLSITCGERIDIGSGTLIGARTTIVDSDHDYMTYLAPQLRGEPGPPHYTWAMTTPRAIRIGCGCFIGTGSVIFPGVTIGDGVIVGANSVVTTDVADYTVAAGVPAKVIRSLREPATSAERPADQSSEDGTVGR